LSILKPSSTLFSACLELFWKQEIDFDHDVEN